MISTHFTFHSLSFGYLPHLSHFQFMRQPVIRPFTENVEKILAIHSSRWQISNNRNNLYLTQLGIQPGTSCAYCLLFCPVLIILLTPLPKIVLNPFIKYNHWHSVHTQKDNTISAILEVYTIQNFYFLFSHIKISYNDTIFNSISCHYSTIIIFK